MPDSYGFDHLPNWGSITVSCIEVGCSVGGALYQWPEKKRLQHHLTHKPVRRATDDFDLSALPTMALKMLPNNAQQSPPAQTPTGAELGPLSVSEA